MDHDTYLQTGIANLELVEQIYWKYRENPDQIDPSWRDYFDYMEHLPPGNAAPVAPAKELRVERKEGGDLRVFNLIQAYRSFGHLMAKINPIATQKQIEPWQLRLETHGFESSELESNFPTFGLLDAPQAKLSAIIAVLREIYSGKIGVEYMATQDLELQQWLQHCIEPTRFKTDLTIDQKKMILQHLNKSELFESFLHTKYVGQKRFSLEGGETLIPILAAIIATGAQNGLQECVIGMAHRGRLNVLSNILDKSYAQIFSEFEEGYIPLSFEGSGDVKYHKGFSSEVSLEGGSKVKVALCPNPSHLEAVNAVVEGRVYAKQEKCGDRDKKMIVPILIHGDAAVAGQGIVYETLQLYRLKGYATGGTIHIVINNQIGFTTVPEDGRSTRYCTDIARTFNAPVFHVNAEDPEGCIHATNLAVQLRQKFHCDVFIDLNCYRKYGHNEADEPAFTQPLEYQIIRKKKPIREIYRDDLIQQGILERQMAEALEQEFKAALQDALSGTKAGESKAHAQAFPQPDPKKHQLLFEPCETGVKKGELEALALKFCSIPEGLSVHRKLEKLIEERLEMAQGSRPIDWGMGETLAYATLLAQGVNVRLSGQDSCRGTFSHRHALWMDQEKERAYYPLKHLKKEQGQFEVYNSPLSEYGVLGFEYGYSIERPKALVLWEAQFGDFSNGAQVIIDQFIATGEMKWGQKNGLVMLLPHGYEGQGPEHSSGRMERFLALCGNDNMQVVNPTSPAQLFHLLRRQVLKPMDKPLIVFSPKGLLRHPECVSQLADFEQGGFNEVLDDPGAPKKAKKLVFCSGRIYYDLKAEREKRKAKDLAIVRIEQLYPLNIDRIAALIKKYHGFQTCFWVQEEPKNMGGWDFIRLFLQELLPAGKALLYIGRGRSASPAAGSYALHKKEHAALIEELFKP